MNKRVRRNSHTVVLLARDVSVVNSINNEHKNCKYLPEFDLPPQLTASTDIKDSLLNCDLIFIALPTQKVRHTLF